MSNGKSFYGGGPARILVVDDHPLVREGLVQIIKRQSDLVCCGEADTAAAAQTAVATHKPDLVTIDIRLQNGDGLEMIRDLTLLQPSLLTLVISQCDETLYAERALKAGARGYVMKERATDEVLTAIRTILAGELYVSPKIAALALHKMIGVKSSNHDGDISNLSNRELQVLQLLGAGLGTKKVAIKLGLSIKTVETHRENIKHKLRLSNAAELVRYAMDWVNGNSPRTTPIASPSQGQMRL
jgi:DNA-binding NarL/FixJ family response regulator